MKAKQNQESTTSEIPEEEETYPIYVNSGTITVTINGNGNVVTFMAGQPPAPGKPPGGNG